MAGRRRGWQEYPIRNFFFARHSQHIRISRRGGAGDHRLARPPTLAAAEPADQIEAALDQGR